MEKSDAMPAPGQPAPDFEGRTQTGEKFRLYELRGRKVALYFYPKDDTPGCTKQACNLRDQHRELLDAGIAVVGISGDDVASHEAFAAKYDLPFPLVADTDHAIMEAYGVWGSRSLYGRMILGTKRTTFLIDEDGIVRHVFKRPKVDEHSREILDRFA